MNGLIRGREVHFDDEYLHVKLEDGRIISTPMEWYEPLRKSYSIRTQRVQTYLHGYRYRVGIYRLSSKYREHVRALYE